MQQENKIFDLIDQGLALHQEGRLEDAQLIYELVLAIEENHFDALQLLGVLFIQTKQFIKADYFLTKALKIKPYDAVAHCNRGLALKELKRLEEALVSYDKAIEINPDYAVAHCNRGNALRELQRLEEALVSYDKAIELRSNLAEAHFNRGNVLKDLQRLEESLASYDKAIELKPDYPEAYSHRGNVSKDLQRLEEAIASYDKAIELKPDYPEAYANRGNILSNLHRSEEALASYDKAIELKPDYPEAYADRGNVLKKIGRESEAKESYDQALLIKPDFVLARWGRAMTVLPIIPNHVENSKSSRIEFSQELSDMNSWFSTQERLKNGHKAVGSAQPFYLAYHEENNKELLSTYGALCHRLMSYWQQKESQFTRPKAFNKPIVVGIVSHHIHQHSVWDALTRGWVEQINRNHFELVFFYTGVINDLETKFAKSVAKDFITCGDRLIAWVKAIFSSQIDILIYPEIGMDPMSIKLANLRLAPVQVGSWGHPDTTGLPTIDYYLSADLFEPDNSEKFYTERLVKLPNLGSHHKPSAVIPISINLEQLSIKADQPLLICPGTPFKYQPQYDHVFVDIAKRLGKCQFIFFTHQDKQLTCLLQERLSCHFLESGLNSKDYCVFIPWQPKSCFFGLMKRADIYLDTIGFSGFNTAYQAIECGLPIVTREGRFMRGRLASGILKKIGLEELIAQDENAFVNLVVKIASNQEYKSFIRDKIEENRYFLYGDLEPIRALEKFLESAYRKSKLSY
ncbi:tetratricopeptide repeat protein [Polynucleobacter hallstattensis]|uniref:tetratricopeptide repeat protein n=1 Tax=Polynucleobacter hallstattensis TaxID=1855586 RepID=UPI001C0BDA3C|nr:glycosyltransferase family 41 protein [Polynucleobacter hallstattensis]MBU3560443.1 tetratricopeptide repeat protein [Polynucleobacter hallstattensis]